MPGVQGVPHPHRGAPRSPQTRARIAAGVRAYHAAHGHGGAPNPPGGGHGHGGGHGGGPSSPPAGRRQPSAAHPNADTRRRVANAQRQLDANSPSAKKAAKREHQKNLAAARREDLKGAFGKGWAAGQGHSAGDVHAALHKVEKAARKKFPKPPPRPAR